MKRNRLYLILAAACILGYSWLFYSLTKADQVSSGRFGACMFKNVTGIPCPSCGSTRAMVMLVRGDFFGSLMMNPIGLILSVIMLVVPIWLLYDVITKRQTLYDSYGKAERIIKIKWVAILLITLVAVNWAWNIYKDL
ncbi:MAG: DUF2752 domain-containing protein [Flavobacterium sp.]|nr:MAG: DUF2752 domain-containing protein [Flavobacterium sp.]